MIPLHQKLLRRYPSEKVARLLALLSGGRLSCDVNSYTMRLDLSEMIEWCMYLGHYEIPQTQWTRECLTRGARFVDVGANFGHYTTLAASIVGPEGSIFAFEPSPRPAAVIEDAIAGNGLENVTLIRSALGKERGHADLYLPLKSNLYSPSLFGGGADYAALRVSFGLTNSRVCRTAFRSTSSRSTRKEPSRISLRV